MDIEKLRDLVTNGLSQDILEAETSYQILMEIGKNAKAINAPGKGNFGAFFGTIQRKLERDVVMSVARLYDQSKKGKRSVRCLMTALQLLEENVENLPSIQQPFQLGLELDRMGVPVAFEEGESDISIIVIEKIKEYIFDPKTLKTLNGIKHLRNMRFAHNLSGEISQKIPDWKEIHALLEKAQKVVGLLGWAYLNIAFTTQEGRYFRSTDARKPTIALRRLLKKLEILEEAKTGSSDQDVFY